MITRRPFPCSNDTYQSLLSQTRLVDTKFSIYPLHVLRPTAQARGTIFSVSLVTTSASSARRVGRSQVCVRPRYSQLQVGSQTPSNGSDSSASSPSTTPRREHTLRPLSIGGDRYRASGLSCSFSSSQLHTSSICFPILVVVIYRIPYEILGFGHNILRQLRLCTSPILFIAFITFL